jgi:hypothetical protein
MTLRLRWGRYAKVIERTAEENVTSGMKNGANGGNPA